jgi:hypothetical protein
MGLFSLRVRRGEMMEMKWAGNITIKVEGKEDTYPPDAIDVERYSDEGISLKFKTLGRRAEVTVRLSPEECKSLMELLKEAIK